MPTIKKKVRKLEAQEPTESRRLWRHLTVALRNNDLENATASKHEVGINKKTAINGQLECLIVTVTI